MKFLIVLAIPIALLITYKITQYITPTKPLEYTIIASLFGLVVWLGKMVFTLKADEGSLKSQINSLEKENSDLKGKHREEINTIKETLNQEMTELKEQHHRLFLEYTKLKDQTSKKPLQKDQKFGYYVDESSNQYCPPCYENNDKRIGLQPCANRSYGWECPICKNIVRNPDYHPRPFNPPRQGRMY